MHAEAEPTKDGGVRCFLTNSEVLSGFMEGNPHDSHPLFLLLELKTRDLRAQQLGAVVIVVKGSYLVTCLCKFAGDGMAENPGVTTCFSSTPTSPHGAQRALSASTAAPPTVMYKNPTTAE